MTAIPLPGDRAGAESGLDYFIARQYSNNLGRFLQTDPSNASAWLFFDHPQSWNSYAYARNNPLAFIDPTGTTYCRVEEDDEGNKTFVDCVSDKEQDENPEKYPDHVQVVKDETVVVTPEAELSPFDLPGQGVFEGTFTLRGAAHGFRGTFIQTPEGVVAHLGTAYRQF